ncbi:MAG: AAA family ATPase [Burkholderiales bacterium]|nr:AAA family ATPase [Burkholderiales bacterium]
MDTRNDQHDLEVILKSRFPLVVVETHEERRVVDLLERIANLNGWAFFVWTLVDGLRRSTQSQPVTMTYGFTDCLRHIEKTPQNGLYALLDAHAFLDDPLNQRLVRQIAAGYAKTERTLVFVSARLELAPELARVAARFELSMPDAEAIRRLVKEEAQIWAQRRGSRATASPDALELLCQHLAGMCSDDARRLVRQALEGDGSITRDDIRQVVRFKHQAMAAGGVLALELDTASFAEVAGMAGLKRWLELRRGPFTGDARALGLDPPKGMLLTGVQGSGKSLAAKAVAGAWGVPLLRLDFGTLYNKFFGETERNLREALAAAEAMAPCVLWIDEIEKGLASDASGGTDGGVSRRVLGTLLTWMAERRSKVFLVATANDIAMLPPELVRKGRFDEIFFVDLPDAPARAEVFRIHLARRKLDPAAFDLAALAALTEGFSGAEVEQAIVAALYEAHAAGRPIDTALVAAEVARTRPLSVTMAERMAALREWARDRTARAD